MTLDEITRELETMKGTLEQTRSHVLGGGTINDPPNEMVKKTMVGIQEVWTNCNQGKFGPLPDDFPKDFSSFLSEYAVGMESAENYISAVIEKTIELAKTNEAETAYIKAEGIVAWEWTESDFEKNTVVAYKNPNTDEITTKTVLEHLESMLVLSNPTPRV